MQSKQLKLKGLHGHYIGLFRDERDKEIHTVQNVKYLLTKIVFKESSTKNQTLSNNYILLHRTDDL